MSFNLSRSPLDSWCFPFKLNSVSNSNTTHYQVIVVACVVIAISAPLAVAGNAFILAAIWRNPSLRTASYVLLAGLAVTDFLTGLLTQPFFVMYRLAEITGKEELHCICGIVTESTSHYFSSLTVIVIVMMAIERWLHMSRRSLLTARRVFILYITFLVVLIFVVVVKMYMWFYPSSIDNVLKVIFYLAGALCVAAAAFAYLKVFQIIRHHQNQIHANDNAIDMKKYKKSIFTILYILMLFVLSYVPYVCCVLVLIILQDFGRSSMAALNASLAVMYSCSFFNPLLYIWRIKEIRDSVKSIIRKIICKQNAEES